MQQVEHYLRQANAARELATKARSAQTRSHFMKIAEAWENLAKERLSFLQLNTQKMGGDALTDSIPVNLPGPLSPKADGDGNPSP